MTAQRKSASAKTAAVVRELHVEAQSLLGLLATYRGVIGDDQIALADMIEGQTDIFPLVETILARIQDVEAMAEATTIQQSNLQNRKKRFEKQAEDLRAVLLEVMTAAGSRYLELPSATLSVTPTPQNIEITDESQIPSDYWKRADPKLDRTALKAALKEGTAVPGACLDNGGETLTIRGR